MFKVNTEELNEQRNKWYAQPMIANKLRDEQTEQFAHRAIALGLNLELPVGEWVAESRRKLKGTLDAPTLKLLQRNIADEGTHYLAFKYALEAYPEAANYLPEAEAIAKSWDSLKDNPIHTAALAETALFLPSLAMLRLYGGQSLITLAGDVSRDEFAHVATNRFVLQEQGYQLHNINLRMKQTLNDTFSWLFQDFSDDSVGIDSEWLYEQAMQLLVNGCPPIVTGKQIGRAHV